MPDPHNVVKIGKGKTSKAQHFDSTVADRFLFMAIEDLDASVLLYHRNHYPQAVFMLQQSVEKMAKSLGIFLTLINDKEAASSMIGHRPLNILKKTSMDIAQLVHEGHKELGGIPEIQNFFKQVGFDSAEADATIDAKVTEIIDDLKKMDKYDLTKKQIHAIVNAMRKRAGKYDESAKKFSDEGISNAEYDAMRRHLEEVVGALLTSTALFPEQNLHEGVKMRNAIVVSLLPDKKSTESIVKFILLLGDCALTLIPLAQLTAPHAVRSRYPMADENFDPLEYYTRNRPIVAALPDLHKFARRATEQIDLLYDILTINPPEYPTLVDGTLQPPVSKEKTA